MWRTLVDTNSTQLPVNAIPTIVFEGQSSFKKSRNRSIPAERLYACRLLGEEINIETCKLFFGSELCRIRRSPYITITPTFQFVKIMDICPEKHFECPQCGKSEYGLCWGKRTRGIPSTGSRGTKENRQSIKIANHFPVGLAKRQS